MYQTLAELKYACDRARAAGQEPPVVTLDGDTTYAYQGEQCVFHGPEEHALLEQALDLLGIPHEEP